MSFQTLDIVLPCYNPQKGWVNSVIENLHHLGDVLAPYQWKLIVVNDGSTNGNVANEKKQLQETLPHVSLIEYHENKGKGFALRHGISTSTADKIIYTDIDFPYAHESFAAVVQALTQADVVLSKRNESYYQNVPPARKLISKVLKSIIKTVMRFDFTDTQAGLKGFDQKIKTHFLSTTSNRYLFDLEFVKKITRDHTVKRSVITVQLKEGVVFSKMPIKLLLGESFSLLKILFQ